jgi:MoaA/NifB/PqqE/SkfB family radical SAM enzyme
MAFDLHSFCPEAWSQLEIDGAGDYKLCCLANLNKDYGYAIDENGLVMNVLTHTMADALNSVTHKEHRKELRENIQPTRCRSCYDSEIAMKAAFNRTSVGKPNDITAFDEVDPANTGWSKRMSVLTKNKKNAYVTIDQADKITMLDGSVTETKIVSLDLRFGNLCNYKCIMCSPVHSNLWYDDWFSIDLNGVNKYLDKDKTIFSKGANKAYELKKDEYGRARMEGTVAWWESDIWWKRFEEVLPTLGMIYFTGGEPMLVPAMLECLDRVIASGRAGQIRLRYDTNLSVINPKLIDKWKHFRGLSLCLSMDDIDERYNLIRFPGNYDNFVRNIKILQKNNVPIHKTTCCIGIASIYTMKRVLDASIDLGINTTFRFLEGPTWLDIRALPKAAKYEIIVNLLKMDGSRVHKMWYNSEVEILRKYFDAEDRAKTTNFVRIMTILDQSRNTDWKTTLPDVYDLLNRHCPEAFKTNI